MKNLIRASILILFCGIFSVVLFSANKKNSMNTNPTYSEMWQKIDSLESKGLYRDALKEVGKVFDYASKTGEHNQVIKSVLYELKYNSYLEEDDYVNGIARLESLIASAPSPSKEILHSLLAEVYWGYYSSNSWKFGERTEVLDVNLEDVRTWDLKRIAVQIRNHYALSLMNESISQAAQITSFSEIITVTTDGKNAQPTIYDFLGHRALNFFKSTTFSVPGPAETFVVEDEKYFLSNKTFLSLNQATQDSLNTRFLTVRVFHALTAFHQRNSNLEPLFHLEMERLKFANDVAVLSEKDEMYYQGMQRLAESYKIHNYAAEAWYEIARYHSNKGNQYNPNGDTTERWQKKKAIDICKNTIKAYPKSYGSLQCEALISEIETKELNVIGEEVLIPATNGKILLNYRNITGTHLKIVKSTHNVYYGNTDKLYNTIRKSKAVYSEKIELEDTKDYNGHSVEIGLPKLSPGFYHVALSTDGSFNHKKGGYAIYAFWVSTITYQTRNSENSTEILVSDRTSGKPIANAEVTVYFNDYDYQKRRYVEKKIGTYTTPENGKVLVPLTQNYYNYSVSIKANNEIYSPQSGIGYYNLSSETTSYTTHLFTDRKIYRPGQSIYFKGIAIQYSNKERELRKNLNTNVTLYDANGQLVKTIDVTTNQFGSFEGEFKAPEGLLTGSMRIGEQYGSTEFRVEEYKRPKFSIEMLPIEGEFQVNDIISATGVATAFAGNKIDGADVSYRIVRSTNYSWDYWWGWRPYKAPKEISNGKLVTDENGEFKVNFQAIPDKESDPKILPIFSYTIYVDVTDVNGETHSTSTSVQVGYQSLQLGNNLSAELNSQEDFTLRIQSTNLNGQDIGSKGAIKVEKLQAPNRVFYGRKWERPDLQNWTKEEFEKLYPNEAYGNEDDFHTWKVEKTAFETAFNTAVTDSVNFANLANWTPGVYKYTARAADKNGIEIVNIAYFMLYNPTSKVAPSNEAVWIRQLESQAEPGETVTILLATMENDVLINCDIEANDGIIETKTIKLSKEQQKLTFKVEEAHRGNLTFHFSTIRNNREFSSSSTVNVPYTNKQLDLSFSTFRNKLLPGGQEEWTLTVKNKGGKQEQAELLATLYDASLDALYTPNEFYLDIYRSYYGRNRWNSAKGLNIKNANNINYEWNEYHGYPSKYYPQLNYFGWSPWYYGHRYYGYGEGEVLEAVTISGNERGGVFDRLESRSVNKMAEAPSGGMADSDSIVPEEGVYPPVTGAISDGKQDKNEQSNYSNLAGITARSNFNETAFFYPQLTADANGIIKIKFTIPETLTKWRFLGLAHTQDLKIGNISEEVVTQKELMVVPNVPRFLREGDEITLATKISNISEENLAGQAQLILYDPFTDKEITSAFGLTNSQVSFTAEKGKSASVAWTIKVPTTYSTVKYKIVAAAGRFSDGEENVLPILSNRMLVTESLPLPLRGKEQKNFNFKKLSGSGASKTLKHHSFTLEFTSNPAWYAIQAMPYMMEYPHECAEQTFTRYYSNAIASHIMNSNLKIKRIVEDWGANSPEAFLSNLQKNQELKAVMLEETPWVLDAKNEEASKRNLAVLLDMERMSNELEKALNKTIKTQSSNGAWPWFPGMPENRYITQHIVTGMGHLDHLGIKDIRENNRVKNMIEKAVGYLDGEIAKDFKNVKRYDADYKKNMHIGYTEIQYLYARSYFPEIGMNMQTTEAVEYYKEQAIKYWLQFNIYAQGMIGLAADRYELETLSNDIVKSLKDRSIKHEEFGMYWKDYQAGYYWYQAPIETQALMIELFDEVADDQESVEELKIWLLKQKQTTNWKTTKQTTEAVYALLLKGTDLLASDELVEIEVGGKKIEYSANATGENPYQVKSQAGTGYFKTNWTADQVTPKLGDIKVGKKSSGVAWGAAYWQYFEDLDKITFAETNLKLVKQLFIVEVSNEGEQLRPISDQNALQVGQKVRVRIELRTDRNLEYVHMKDMRAAGFEPVDVLSMYHYQDGLGYYQSTKDVATHFFFDYVPKGTYVFEYDLRVQQKGNFANGITTIQCMYAPEFTAHSNGIRVNVK